MEKVADYFGCNVFNDRIMRDKLPRDIYLSLKKTIQEGEHIEDSVAQIVATVMKDWAIEKGATHYTHWFQPMTGITAEKHDAFIAPADGGRVIMEFSGKELIKGEPDASSFPSGGLRATFEARGYTVWDPTSYAFVKDGTLYIPTAFCSYSGEALDNKTPLLRSMDALNKAALSVLKFFDSPAKRVIASVGAEQEYFLIDREMFMKREDLRLTGRTLFGARPPKGQEMEDHYFGNIKERVADYMKELDRELWKLGVYAKTKHNEVAPSQHELAPVFSTCSVAADHNQLIMDVMKKVAERHGLVCLLHEKPFAGINGSGKHNNWSMITDTGENLLKPGKTPGENYQFLIFLTAVLKAVDEHSDLLKASVSSAGNDHRLGGNEAPPAIMSVYLGEQLTKILEAFSKGEKLTKEVKQYLETGVAAMPLLKKDVSDRNRTSPFAFTGNKFEFRMGGSAQSISEINTVLNTIIAEALSQFAQRLEKTDDVHKEMHEIIKDSYLAHKRIVFNSNNYSEEWLIEAEKRGLPNQKNAVESIRNYIAEKNVRIFSDHKVFSPAEIHARYEIYLGNYINITRIESATMLDMAKKEILPAALAFQTKLLKNASLKKELGVSDLTAAPMISRIEALINDANGKIFGIEKSLREVAEIEDIYERARYYSEKVFSEMNGLRTVCDELEVIVSKKQWPFPTYTDILFYV